MTASDAQVEFWLAELRSPAFLIELTADAPEAATRSHTKWRSMPSIGYLFVANSKRYATQRANNNFALLRNPVALQIREIVVVFAREIYRAVPKADEFRILGQCDTSRQLTTRAEEIVRRNGIIVRARA